MVNGSEVTDKKIAWDDLKGNPISASPSHVNDVSVKVPLISDINPNSLSVLPIEEEHHCLQVDTESPSFLAGFTNANPSKIDISDARLIAPDGLCNEEECANKEECCCNEEEYCSNWAAILKQIVIILQQLISDDRDTLEIGILDFLSFINSGLIDGKKVLNEYQNSRSQNQTSNVFLQVLSIMYRLLEKNGYLQGEKNGYLPDKQKVDVPASLAMLKPGISKTAAEKGTPVFTPNFTGWVTTSMNGTATNITSACAAAIVSDNACANGGSNVGATAIVNVAGTTADIATAINSKPSNNTPNTAIVHAYEKSCAEEHNNLIQKEDAEKIVATWWEKMRDRWIKPLPTSTMGAYFFRDSFQSKVVFAWLKKHDLINAKKLENRLFLYLTAQEKRYLDDVMASFELIHWWNAVNKNWVPPKESGAGYYVCNSKNEVVRVRELLHLRHVFPKSNRRIIDNFMFLNSSQKEHLEKFMLKLSGSSLSEKMKKK